MMVFPTPIRVLLGLQSPQPGAEEKKATEHNERDSRPGSSSPFLFFIFCESSGHLLTLSEPSFLLPHLPDSPVPVPANPLTLYLVKCTGNSPELPLPREVESSPPLSRACCVSLGNCLSLSEPSFPCLPLLISADKRHGASQWYHLSAGEATAGGGQH